MTNITEKESPCGEFKDHEINEETAAVLCDSIKNHDKLKTFNSSEEAKEWLESDDEE